jgi:hypothetical protein
MTRFLAGLLAAILGANALVQLAVPFWWYGMVPGAAATGPFNPHFVRDVGAAYLVTAAGLAAFAWNPRQAWPALAAGAAFLTLHAGIHVFDALCGARPLADTLRDAPGVHLTALIALVLLARSPAFERR